jgi:hypothetical protein
MGTMRYARGVFGNITFDEAVAAYRDQAEGLADVAQFLHSALAAPAPADLSRSATP